jgi:tyrosyl-tRNA synthetase
LKEQDFLSIFEGVPQFLIERDVLENTLSIIDLLTSVTSVIPSKGEARRLIEGGGLSINKEKINSPDNLISKGNLLNNKYILVQKGKKNYNLIIVK